MVALIFSIVGVVLFAALSLAAMNKKQNKIALTFVYLSVASLLIGLVSYAPYNSFEESQRIAQERKSELTKQELENNRATKMITALGSVESYLSYLAITEGSTKKE